ncbi:MAG: ribonuclease III [Lachnospirales bacterium]
MYEKLYKKLGYVFNDESLIKLAFSHTSIINETKEMPNLSNQRLEYLGDAVLELSISEKIYKLYPDMLEGDMTKFRANLVCEPSLAHLAKTLRLHDYIEMSKGEMQSMGNHRESVLADCMEAVFGAIFLDAGFDKSKIIIVDLFRTELKKDASTFQNFDYKTTLQEEIQSFSKTPLVYTTTGEEGPDHDKIFHVSVCHKDKTLGKGSGKSKKEAEQNSAKEALISMDKI